MPTVAQILVRNIPDDVKERLKRRATRSGRSLEAEVRDILCAAPEAGGAAVQRESLVDAMQRIARETGVTNADIDALQGAIAEGRKHRKSRVFGFNE